MTDIEKFSAKFEEVQIQEELTAMLQGGQPWRAYDGFEPSGRMHVAQGLMKTELVNACIDSGATFVFWVADIFAYINGKMYGDLEAIQKCGEYFIHVWKSCGMKTEKVEFLFAYPEINAQAADYYRTVLDISRRFTVARIKKCATIMGKSEDDLAAAQLLYPIMQCSDPFFLKVQACQLGLDQRKVNMLAREYATATKRKFKPIVLSHHMMMGLVEGAAKASKSNPNSAVFMEDPPEEVNRKISEAFCPKDVATNPVLDWIKHLIFCAPEPTFECGSKTFTDYQELQDAFMSDAVTEEQIKTGLAVYLNARLAPTQKHFEENEDAKALLDWLKDFKTRKAGASTDTGMVLKKILTSSEAVDGSFVVAPLATPKVRMDVIVSLLRQLKIAATKGNVVLCIPTFSSMVMNTMNTNMADWKKDMTKVTAFYDKLLKKLNTIEPELMKQVKVVQQHESIEREASDYWYVAISAGQVLSVPTLVGKTADEMESTPVGEVVSRLMFIADVLLSRCKTLVIDAGLARVVECMEVIQKGCNLDLLQVESVNAELIGLSNNKDTPVDKNFIFLDDPKNVVASKIKKAFCEPKNIEYNPLIDMAEKVLIPLNGNIVAKVQISESETQNKEYNSDNIQEMKNEFEQDILTPQNLKAAVSDPIANLATKLLWK